MPSLTQDKSLPDAMGEFAGVGSRFVLLLPHHIQAILVELERLLPPLLLYQQSHQAAQRVLIARVLLQSGEEEFLRLLKASVLLVELHQLVKRATACSPDGMPSSL